MQTECVRCHKTMDTVQGYKFSPTEYVCMSCYDEFKAERAAKLKKDHKNPLLDRYGTEGVAPDMQTGVQQPEHPISQVASEPAAAPLATPQKPAPPAPQQMFAPKSATPTPATPQIGEPKSAPPKKAPPAEICDVCQKPIPDFKVPLKGGKKVCLGCNDVLREVAKSLILNVQCPQCGHEFKVAED